MNITELSAEDFGALHDAVLTEYAKRERKAWAEEHKNDMAVVEYSFDPTLASAMTIGGVPRPPPPGSDIYLRGGDDYCGGLAQIETIYVTMSAGCPAWAIRFREVPSVRIAWDYLLEKQDMLRERYGDLRAREG